KELTLDFSKYLGDILNKQGYEIKYMRDNNDTKLSLKERIDKANTSGAKIFISIHANSSATDKTAKGVDIFYMSEEAEDNYSKIVAQQENKFFEKQKADDDAGNIINSMLVNGHIKEGAKLASEISAKLSDKNINRGVKKAPFAVLSGPTMPSILIEIGFMSNSEDLKRIASPSEMKSLASKIASGINSYLSSYKGS
ncbi:MAG: N-acetylmuramoyl-L-alanine amidase, partial [Proteobacteria bacterium]|nr:N-acetylmuramoyl-L-alanine amidase [Pseudomonadota bacterium]